ncbi:T9SS type A sorting domain-containing protein [Hymenobacter weizhouensis]|uniref:T9SS type A sorting domain-containing protein n=1 Tax=Hymenobacter sp. YIM 151500-1 TaxID=2987689 RepID=UPI0022273966|nr:T9SS type A sorting domain-containing protein [Hymenobacter sp. YIM 151500-1]UYZ62506.1 T9SS type A sorting domain-containing protein [Hymenobacter sp. YIM 151500-1]
MKKCFWLLSFLLLPWAGRAQTQIPLGAGLDGVTDWSQSRPFVDVMKSHRGFGSAQTPYDNQPPRLDANGWPLGDFGMVVMADMRDNTHLYGTYKLSFKGQATVSNVSSNFSVQNYRYDAATNTSTADVVVPAQPDNQMMMAFRNVGASGVQDIRLIMPGYTAAETFTRPLKEHLQRFQVLRFMDWTSTNGNPVSKWSERTVPTSPSQMSSKGVAWEYCIQLCNETQKDMWLNVPLRADDDYVRELAKLVKARLNPGLRCYVEYSNEIWNYNFSQFHENVELAKAEVAAGNSNLDDGVPTDTWKWAHRRTGKRLMQISNIFRAEFGDAAMMTRIRPVLAGQIANPWEFPGTALNFVHEHYGPPKNFFYAVAGAPYFGIPNQRAGMSKAEILAAFRQNIADMWAPSNTRTAARSSEFDIMTAQATWFGLKHFCYEGGPDTFGPENIQAKKDASLDPAMKDVVLEYLRGWYGHGGPDGLFMWFVAGATNYDSQYGTWGLTNSMMNLNSPKIEGIDQAIARLRPQFTAGFAIPDSIDTRQHVGYRTGWKTTNPNALPYLHAGDQHDYLLNVPATGTYRLRVRLARVGGNLPSSSMRVLVNNTVVQDIVTPGDPNNNWEKFVLSPPVTLQLQQGLSVLRLRYITECNATKSLLFERVGTATSTTGAADEAAAVLYPNPAHKAVSISFASHVAQPVRVAIRDVQGRLVWQKTYAAQAGNNALEADIRPLAAALYVVQVRGQRNGQQATLRLAVQ